MNSSKILFVDDNLILSLDSQEFLQGLGYVVEAVNSAAAALEVIYRQEILTALVTDIDLGPGLNGFEVARHARAVHPRLPVIYISGTMGPSHPREGVPGSEFIAKPFQPIQIAQALERAIRPMAA